MRIAGNDRAAIVRVTDRVKALITAVGAGRGFQAGTDALVGELMAVLEEARGDGFLIPCKAVNYPAIKAGLVRKKC